MTSPTCEDLGALALHSVTEPSFIRKRNERERERVRCVNEGYERLKEHLPLTNKEKRISKVETLRGAIDYIRQLEQLLAEAPPVTKEDHQPEEKSATRTKSQTKVIALDMDDVKRSRDNSSVSERTRKRRGSLSSEQSVLSDSTLSESEDENCFKKQRLHPE
nr:hypothetical protein BaRGS_004174 [Batillaria attramentaria]